MIVRRMHLLFRRCTTLRISSYEIQVSKTLSFLVYTTSFGSIPYLYKHQKLTSCLGGIKCPRIEAPLCVRVKNIAHQKTEYILILNKCEMKYFKCYSNLDAAFAPMKVCYTGNETQTLRSGSQKRIKRDLRKTLEDKVGVIQFSSAHQKNEDILKLTEWSASSIEEFEETVHFGFVVGVAKVMEDVLPYARDAIEAVLDTVSDDTSKRIRDLVLSVYVWPQINGSLFLRTEDTDEFMVAVNDVHCLASQQNDSRCEQDIYQASTLGLERAMPRTHMFVFANGAPTENDFYFESEVKRIAQEKEVKVNFVVTGDCDAPNERPFQSFYSVAAETRGQVLRIRKTHLTGQFLKYINHTVMEFERSVILSTVYRAGGSSQLRIPFNVSEDDDMVTVTVSGEDCDCAVYNNRNNTLKYTYDVITKHVKMYKYMGLNPGTYRIQLHPNMLSDPPQDLAAPALVSVAVSRVELLFKYGFSKTKTNTLKNTEAQPRDNTPLYIIIAVREPRNLVKVANVSILGMLNEVISTYSLIETSKEDVYRTKRQILIPKRKHMKIKITGSLRDTPKYRKLIERVSTRIFRPFQTEGPNEVTESPRTSSSAGDSGYNVAKDVGIEKDSSLTATEGDRVRIVCALPGAKNVKWSFRKKYSRDFKNLRHSGRTLLLDPVSMEDAGYYRSDYYDYIQNHEEEQRLKGVSKPRQLNWKHLSPCLVRCPARDVMVCARCQHGVHRTFLSECYMRMYQCKNPMERLELVAHRPCAASAPYLGDLPRPGSRLPSPASPDDGILRFMDERQRH